MGDKGQQKKGSLGEVSSVAAVTLGQCSKLPSHPSQFLKTLNLLAIIPPHFPQSHGRRITLPQEIQSSMSPHRLRTNKTSTEQEYSISQLHSA